MNDPAKVLSPPFDRHPPDFLAGGGELGALMRAHNWAGTPLGPPAQWPQSLKTAVRIMLTSRQPIWIGWGRELIYFYNDAYRSIIGGKHPWALGRPASEVWREIWGDIGPMLATAMTGLEGTYVEAQLLIMERNGYPEETYYTFSYSPIPDDDGSPGGIICANTDDTQRVIGERQLALLRDLAAGTADARNWREACERSAAALATDPHDLPFAMIYMAEPDGGTVSLVAACGIEAGRPASPVSVALDGPSVWPLADAARDHRTCLVPDLAARFGDALPTGAWSQAPAQAAVLPILPAGETGRAGVLVVGLNPFRLFDDGYRGFLNLTGGQIAAAIANADAYEEERRRAEALAEIDRAKTLFFSNVSHEFRTPLTLMMGQMEEVLAKPEGQVLPDNRALIEVAHRNGLRLLRLVNSLLDFSRIEAGRVQASFEPTDLAALTTDLASNFRSACERAGLRLTVNCPPLPEAVYVDREMWEKIVLNLLSNAFKFTFEGEIAVELGPGDGAVLTVRDTGTGIPAHELPRLFERFHRVEGAKGRSYEGSGIGLALVQELVKLHGGWVRVESEEGRGTAFTVSIPFGTAHLPQNRIRGERGRVSTALRAHAYVEEALRWLPGASRSQDMIEAALDRFEADLPAPVSGARPRVLLADDNADMRDYVRRLLSTGYEVETVPDGRAALAAIRARKPDLVITDVMMPHVDGYGVVEALRADPETRELPVIMLSARAGEEASIEGLEAGADDYLIKPFSARELRARVAANLTLARVRGEATAVIREREERLRAALEASGTGTFRWDIRSNALEWDDALDRLFGLPPGRTARSLDQFLALVHPDDRGGVIERCERCAREGADFEMEFRVVWPDGGVHWLYDRGKTFRGADGRPAYMAGACVDVTERKRAEEALRRRTGQFETLLNEAPLGVYLVDADFRIREVNPTAFPFFGDIPDLIGRDFDEVIHILWPKAYADEIVARFRHTLETGEPYYVPERIEERRDRGLTEYYEWQVSRLPLPEGGYGVVCYFRDISAQVLARQAIAGSEQALRESEAFLRLMLDAAADGFYCVDREGTTTLCNAAFLRMLGFERPEHAIGRKLHDVIHHSHPGGSPYPRSECPIYQTAQTGRPAHVEGDLFFRLDGSSFPVEYWVHPIRSNGELQGAVCTFIDITERQRAREQQNLLLRELNHRVKNLFAVASGMVMLSARSAGTPQEMAKTLRGRLDALARAHELIRRGLTGTGNGADQSTTLDAILREVVAPYVDQGPGGNERFAMNGPTVAVGTNGATSLALLLHELTTNAVKYGALSVPNGHVSIEWSEQAGDLLLKWEERGGPTVQGPPSGQGFGSLLAQRTVSGQLGGRLSYDWKAEGIIVDISAPLQQLIR